MNRIQRVTKMSDDYTHRWEMEIKLKELLQNQFI